jgi:lipid-binding SYLF domain-containing protein
VKKFMLVWIFTNDKAFNQFVNSGWSIGGQASATAKAGGVGGAYEGAIPIASGIWLYQLAGSGLALELTAKGTKYYKDNDLNASAEAPASAGGNDLREKMQKAKNS